MAKEGDVSQAIHEFKHKLKIIPYFHSDSKTNLPDPLKKNALEHILPGTRKTETPVSPSVKSLNLFRRKLPKLRLNKRRDII